MLTVFLSVLPVFLLIIVGFFCKKFFIKEEIFWKSSDKFVYYIFFPSLLLISISNSNFYIDNLLPSILSVIISTFFIILILFFIKFIFHIDSQLFTSIFQGGVRYNSYIFIALSQSLFGNDGAALSGVFIAYMIVLTNIMSVMVLNHYGNSSKKSIKSTLIALIKNPLIIGALIGIFLNNMGFHIIGSIQSFLTYLGNAATPLSLMSVGAGLTLTMHSSRVIAMSYAVVLKLLIMPIFTIFLLKLQAIEGPSAHIAILYSAVPSAGNAYILSRQLGGDSEAMAAIITWTTLVSMISIPFIIGTIMI